jgi:16S rRNA (adenine1518-N6/adenine1519-N6)-dimethyltransferase
MTQHLRSVTRSDLNETLHAYGLEPHRTLGQNFLVDPNTIERIVRLSGVQRGDRVIEIGPGVGSLSVGLLRAGAELTMVEIDERLVAPLRQRVGPTPEILVSDATQVDWSTVTRGDQRVVVANLPYNVATSVVLRILDEAPEVRRLLVMVQREAGERLVAEPGSRVYGIPSVKVRYWATARIVGSVSAEVFHPKPKVESVLVRIDRREPPIESASEPVNTALMFHLVRTAFGQRRKTLRSSLRGEVSPEQFEAAGVDSGLRPERLDVEEWRRLSRSVGSAAN